MLSEYDEAKYLELSEFFDVPGLKHLPPPCKVFRFVHAVCLERIAHLQQR